MCSNFNSFGSNPSKIATESQLFEMGNMPSPFAPWKSFEDEVRATWIGPSSNDKLFGSAEMWM